MSALEKPRPQICRDELDQTLGRDPYAYATRTGRGVLEQRFEAYAASLPRGTDGTIARHLTVDRACPLCQSRDSRLRFIKYGFPVHACRECGFEFARPILDQRQVDSGALGDPELSHDHLKFITQPTYQACAALRFEFELQQLLQHWHAGRGPRRFLEIGSSTGIGLGVARSYGLRSVGIEPNRDAAAIARSAGHDVLEDFFAPGRMPPGSFDLAMTLDVLEHVPEPVTFLSAARDVLAPGGLLLVQVPNAGALITRLEGAHNQIYNGLVHVNYFDPPSLDRTARAAGLEVVKTTSFLSELGKIRAYSRERIEASIAEYAPALVRGWRLHQDWINDHGLGYKILGIYRRL